MDLKQKLLQYGSEDIYPMHMPGHKRNLNMVSMGEPYAIDITEIHGFDDLHDAKGALAHGMERAAKLLAARKLTISSTEVVVVFWPRSLRR